MFLFEQTGTLDILPSICILKRRKIVEYIDKRKSPRTYGRLIAVLRDGDNRHRRGQFNFEERKRRAGCCGRRKAPRI